MMSAPTLGALAQVITTFITSYMGIGQPIRDNGFVHASQKHKYVTRKNRVGANQWDSRYTMKLEVIGVATTSSAAFREATDERVYVHESVWEILCRSSWRFQPELPVRMHKRGKHH